MKNASPESEVTTTNMDSRVDEELERAIEKTLESEQEFRTYINQERQQRRVQETENDQKEEDCPRTETAQPTEEEIQEEFESEYSIGVDPTLDKYTARVRKVEFNKIYKERFTIKLEDHEGETHVEEVKSGLPEDASSEWVRLCEWVGVDPATPSELRGETVPIIQEEDGVSIDMPPVNKRLNPLAFHSKRKISKIYNTLRSIDIIAKSAFLSVMALVALTPLIGMTISFSFFFWANSVSSTNTAWELISIILFIPMFGLLLASTFTAVVWYGKFLVEVLRIMIAKSCSGVTSVYLFLFPKE